MERKEIRNWTSAGVYRGLFDGYVITANKHVSPDDTAWHIRIHVNSGDIGQRDYWVESKKFSKTLKQLIDDTGAVTVETGGTISNMAEKAAIEKAIALWSTEE